MKKKIIFFILIFMSISSLAMDGFLLYQHISKSHGIEKPNIVSTKPTTPYGFDYLNDWQQQLYRALESMQIGDDYYLDREQNLQDVQMVIDLYNQNTPRILPTFYSASENNVRYDKETDTYIGDGTSSVIHFDVWGDYNIAEGLQKVNMADKKAEEIIASIPNNASDYGKVKVIYDYLVKNVKYDYDTFNANINNQPLDISNNANNAYGALIENKAICSGMAKAFHYVADKAGVYVLYATSTDHAWNIVWLDGKYYRIDVTSKHFLILDEFVGEYIPGIPLPDTKHEYPYKK